MMNLIKKNLIYIQNYLVIIIPLFLRIGIIFFDGMQNNKTYSQTELHIPEEYEQEKISNLEYQLAFAYEETNKNIKINDKHILQEQNKTQITSKNNFPIKQAPIPVRHNIANVIFFSQAPTGNRNEPYQNACEEASILLAFYYVTGQKPSKSQYNKDLLNLLARQHNNIGHHSKTNFDQFLYLIQEYLKFPNAYLLENASIEELKREISKGNVIVASFRGKEFYNPHYSLNGPIHHVMLIKGYNENNFIIHDVGTTKGEDREYNKQIIMDAMTFGDKNNLYQPGNKVIVFQK